MADTAASHLTAARQALAAGDLPRAEAEARAALALAPGHLATLGLLAAIARQRRDPAATLPILDDILAQAPDHADALRLKGMALAETGKILSAARTLEAAGTALWRQNRRPEAEATWRAALAFSGGDGTDAWFALAVRQQQAGLAGAAKRILHRILISFPDHPAVLAQLAQPPGDQSIILPDGSLKG